MRRLLVILCAALWLGMALAPAAQASPVVADISTYRIAIDSRFDGIRVFLFGARNDAGDVVVVVRSPLRSVTVRKKERVAGMWVNRRQMTFQGVPDFYAVAATSPPGDLDDAAAMRRTLGIGDDTLMSTPPGERPWRAAEFAQAFRDHQHKRGLYPNLLPLSFMGETLFKTVIPFPDTIPRGVYTAEIYLIRDGALIGMQSLPIRVEKSGLDAAVYDFAYDSPLLYGMCAVLLALAAGWIANGLFAHN